MQHRRQSDGGGRQRTGRGEGLVHDEIGLPSPCQRHRGVSHAVVVDSPEQLAREWDAGPARGVAHRETRMGECDAQRRPQPRRLATVRT